MKIKDFENYLITPVGNVINLKTGRVLKPYGNGNGYLKVTLYKNGRKFRFLVHRLVAEIRGAIPKKMCVDHINRNKTDNRLENLRVVSYLENNLNRGGIFERHDKTIRTNN